MVVAVCVCVRGGSSSSKYQLLTLNKHSNAFEHSSHRAPTDGTFGKGGWVYGGLADSSHDVWGIYGIQGKQYGSRDSGEMMSQLSCDITI